MALDLGTMLQGSLALDSGPFTSGLDDAMGKLRDFGGKGFKIAAAAGAGIATAMGASVVANLDVEAGNDKLAAQLGLSEAESARIGAVAGSLYGNAYGENLGEVNDAVGAVMSSIEGMSDASGKRLENVTAKALDFAAAFDIDVNRAVQVAGQAVTTGLAKNATQAFDLITAASQRVPANLREDVLDAADEYGQFFAQLGFDGPEAFGLLVTGAEKGMYGIDKAGDAIKEFTIRSTDMSTASKDAYKAIGLDAREMADAILRGGDDAKGATDKILDGLLSMKPGAKQANAAIALFGTPLEDIGTKDIPKFLESLQGGSDAMKGFGGASKRMGDTLNDNANTALTSLRRKGEQAFLMLGNWALPHVNNMAMALGENLGPALRRIADFLASPVLPALKQMGDFIAANQTPILVISGLILAVFIPHLVALGTASVVARAKVVAAWIAKRGAAVKTAAVHSVAILKMMAFYVQYAAVSMVQAGRVVVSWAIQRAAAMRTRAAHVRTVAVMVAHWAVLGAKSLLHAAKVAAAWLIAIGPIGLVIAAVVGLVVLIVKNWDKIKRYTGAAWEWIVSKVSGAWSRVKDATVRKAGEVVSWVAGLPGRIKDSIGDLSGLLVGAGRDVVIGLWEGIKAMGPWLFDQITGFISDNLPGPVKKALGISSPSRVMRDLARHIPEGLVLGIDDGVGDVARAADRMGRASIPRSTRVSSSPRGMSGMFEGGTRVHAPIQVTMPATATPGAAGAAAGGRIAAELEKWGL